MTEQLEECNLNMFLENTSNIKEELDVNDYVNDKVYVHETIVSDIKVKSCARDDPIEEDRLSDVNNIKTELLSQTVSCIKRDNLKTEAETDDLDIKIEFNNKLLFCDHCLVHYQDYCSKCGMLVCILNKNGLTDIDNTASPASEELPKDILEIRMSSGYVGVFALKCIPKGVRFGPFFGVTASECSWRLKGGKFILNEEKSTCLNWMQYINTARSISEQNLLVFQSEERLYYRTIQKIYEGEELLVYFGDEYVDNLNENIEMVLIPHIENDTKDVYACTFCCLGFCSGVDLVKHKSICFKEANREFSIKELVQCSFCKIHLDAKEYMENHMSYCSERYTRKHNPLAPGNQAVDVKGCRSRRLLQTYECKQCLYKTAYKADLKNHTNKHNEVKMYKCGICNRRSKTKESVKAHVEKMHIDIEKATLAGISTNDYQIAQVKVRMFKCSKCKYQSTNKYYLKKHIKTKHLEEFDYKCSMCGYKTNIEKYLNYHIKTKHLKKFDYKCDLCDYKTNYKSSLNRHVKTMCSTTDKLEANITWHSEEVLRYTQDDRKQFKCLECEFETKYKQCMKRHIRTQHLKKFRYKCDSCEYMVDRKSVLEKHIKTIHLKVYNYNCDMCDWKSNERSHLKLHVQAKHFEVFKYKCESCPFKTNRMTRFKIHMKRNHLPEFKYTCSSCGYKTNNKKYLQSHMKTNHLEAFDYECGVSENKINQQIILNEEDCSTSDQLKIQHHTQGSVRVYKC